jgi:YD repeat-containing protein
MRKLFRQTRFPLILFFCLSLAFPPELVAQAFNQTPATSPHTYVYDLVGNRLEKQVAGEPNTLYSYNSLDQLTQETTDGNTIVYSYNDNGSLIRKDDGTVVTDYTYNLQERLSSVDDGTSAVGYEYDTDGVRVQKSIAGGATTNYLIDHYNHTGYPQVFKESTGSAQTAYIIGSEIIAQATDTADPGDYFTEYRDRRPAVSA